MKYLRTNPITARKQSAATATEAAKTSVVMELLFLSSL